MMLVLHIIKLMALTYIVTIHSATVPKNIETPTYWRSQANAEIKRKLTENRNENEAKNVILFLGDGMSIPTVTAGRILKGQLKGHHGEETTLTFDKFPTTGLSKTYCQDAQVTDSAASATAFLSGIKTNKGMVGVDATVKRGDCPNQHKAEVTSILDWSLAAGKSVGIVTTTSITSATVAAAFANVADRYWENDRDMRNVVGGCKDIAAQLIDEYPQIQVIMGGGRKHFTGRIDKQDLITNWKIQQRGLNRTHHYIQTLNEARKVDPNNTDSVLGLFAYDNMKYDLERTDPSSKIADEPSLAEMTELAIKILSKNSKGFFLLVEGGRIDHAHHAGIAKLALFDFLAFERAVTMGDGLTNESDSLIIVTADHSHTLTFVGYSDRGNDILGKVTERSQFSKATDRKPYTTLLYGNGPGHTLHNGKRPDISRINTAANRYRQQAAVPLPIETHGGDDVGIWSRGPMSHLLSGTHEQNYIAHVMAFASCVGNYANICPKIATV